MRLFGMMRIIGLFFLSGVLLMNSALSALEKNCVEGDCKNGRGEMVLDDGSRYLGDFKDGKMEGEGKIFFSGANDLSERVLSRLKDANNRSLNINGAFYTGEFSNNLMHGKGEFVFQNRSRYIGVFVMGKFGDNGTFYNDDGDMYETKCIDGECEDDEGIMLYQDGWECRGEFREGMLNGNGRCIHAIGHEYNGEFKDDRREGKGELVWVNGSRYMGEFRNGFFDGKGTYIFPNGNRYVGTFRMGKRDGTGELYLKNKRLHYKGQWKNDEKNGMGVTYIYFKNGNISKKYAGVYRNDQFTWIGTYYEYKGNNVLSKKWVLGNKGNSILYEFFSDNEKIVGQFKNGNILGYGKGTHYRPDGKKYEGEFFNGEYSGKGTLYNKKGEKIYEGEWKENKMQGEGTYYYGDNTSYTGSYEEGMRNGMGIFIKKDRFGNIIYKFEGQFKNDKKFGKGSESEYERSGNLLRETTGWWDGDKYLGK